ncbi:MAG: pyridoxamine 5'-phosphate oxidase family protein [Nanoarchaeota archaeon]|nr:pyridoxamine 5'-phosphate oxidase family protein [Nanoarchaeota archaeon]
MKKLLEFLNSQKLLVFSTYNSRLWITNVYYCSNDECDFFFISESNSKHSKDLLNNSNVAFSVSWFDKDNLNNRKGIQGEGTCIEITEDRELDEAVNLYKIKFDNNNLSSSYFKSNDNNYKMYLIKPKKIKFWNDEVYGEERVKIFSFE